MKKTRKDYIWPELMECRCVKRDQKIYFFAKNYNALCAIDLEIGTIEMVESISDEYFDTEGLITSIWNYKNDLICVPYTAKQIHIIDLVLGEDAEQIILENNILRRGYFYSAYLEDKYCYLFPLTGNKMIQVDIEQKKVIKAINMKKEYNNFSGSDYVYFSYSGCYAFENKIYTMMYDTAIIVEFDLLSMKTHFHKLCGQSPYYIHITGYRNNLYVLGSDGEIYIWNIEKHSFVKSIKLLYKEETDRFKYSVRNEKYIYIFKYKPSDEFIRIDIETNHAEVCSINKMFHFADSCNIDLNYMTMDNGIFYFLSQEHEVYMMEFETLKYTTILLEINETKAEEFIQSHEDELDKRLESSILEGARVWTLENYITRHVNSFNNKQLDSTKEIGTVIFKTINTK